MKPQPEMRTHAIFGRRLLNARMSIHFKDIQTCKTQKTPANEFSLTTPLSVEREVDSTARKGYASISMRHIRDILLELGVQRWHQRFVELLA